MKGAGIASDGDCGLGARGWRVHLIVLPGAEWEAVSSDTIWMSCLISSDTIWMSCLVFALHSLFCLFWFTSSVICFIIFLWRARAGYS